MTPLTPTVSRGVLGRLADRLGRTQSELEAQELLEDTAHSGCARIADVQPRQMATVTGSVRSVALQPRASVPTLEVELYDGSGVVQLIWLGRRRITGIEPGARLTAHGRVATVRGGAAIFNPSYELVPTRG